VILITDAGMYDSFSLDGFSVGDFRSDFETEGVSFRFVEFSSVELEEINDAIYEIIAPRFGSSYCAYIDNVVFWGIDGRMNRVVVKFEVLNDEKIAGFRQNVLDSPALSFGQMSRVGGWGIFADAPPSSFRIDESALFSCDYDYSGLYHGFCDIQNSEIQTETTQYIGITPFSANVHPGDHLFRGTTFRTGAGTMGFRVRCRDTGEIGFVTALHGWTPLGIPVPPRTPAYATTRWAITGNRVGELARQSGLTDSIFFSARNGTPSNTLPTGQTLSTTVNRTFLV